MMMTSPSDSSSVYSTTLPSPPSFRDIPAFTQFSGHEVDISWRYLKHWMAEEAKGADLDPDFQRGHVWTVGKKAAFVEFVLRGGESARNIYFNCAGYSQGRTEDFVLVDGKQRLSAVLGFLDNEFPIFGQHYHKDFTDEPDRIQTRFRMCVNGLKTRAEVLQWYLDLNTGGVVHTDGEIEKVRRMLAEEVEAGQ